MWNIDYIPSRENPQVIITYPNKKTYIYDVTYGIIEELSRKLSHLRKLPDIAKPRVYKKISDWIKDVAYNYKPRKEKNMSTDDQLYLFDTTKKTKHSMKLSKNYVSEARSLLDLVESSFREGYIEDTLVELDRLYICLDNFVKELSSKILE